MVPAKNCQDVGLVVGEIQQRLTFHVDLSGLKPVEEMPLCFGTMHRLSFGDSYAKQIDPNKAPPAPQGREVWRFPPAENMLS